MEKKTRDEFIMSPKVDYCFKELLTDPEVRKGLVAAILNVDPQEIQETELMPTVLSKDGLDGKYGILDVRIRMKDRSQIGLEMQVAPFTFWDRRIIFYLGKMYTEQMKTGEGYEKLQKCVHVSILDFIHFPNDQECFREIALCDMKTKEKYTDQLEIYVLELKKLPPEQQEEPLVIKWMRFLAGSKKEDFEKMAVKDEYIGEAYEVLQKLSADERKQLEYDAGQKAMRDRMDFEYRMKQAMERAERAEQVERENARMNELYEKLLNAGRIQDLQKAVSDEEYRKNLYEEFVL